MTVSGLQGHMHELSVLNESVGEMRLLGHSNLSQGDFKG